MLASRLDTLQLLTRKGRSETVGAGDPRAAQPGVWPAVASSTPSHTVGLFKVHLERPRPNF